MSKKNLTCEIKRSIKGLDPKKPGEFTHPGTEDEPTLVELPDNKDTRALVDKGFIRVWPGPKVEPDAGGALKPAELKSLKKAEEILASLVERYRKELAASEDDATRAAIEADIQEAETDLGKVRELLK